EGGVEGVTQAAQLFQFAQQDIVVQPVVQVVQLLMQVVHVAKERGAVQLLGGFDKDLIRRLGLLIVVSDKPFQSDGVAVQGVEQGPLLAVEIDVVLGGLQTLVDGIDTGQYIAIRTAAGGGGQGFRGVLLILLPVLSQVG